MRDPLISILMPAYNSARFLEAAVTSVLEQTYTEWELLIIDDASSDATVSIAEKMQQRAPGKIRLLINERNSGVAVSRNRGVQVAKGSYIAFMDSDDLWKKDKLKKQVQLLKKQKEAGRVCPLLFTGSAFIREDGTPLTYTLEVPSQIGYRELLKQNRISCSSVLAEREWLLRYPMPTEPMLHEDFAVWLRILKPERGKAPVYAYAVQEPLLIYRVSEGSKSADKKKAALMNLRTYRAVGLHPAACLYNMAQYMVRSLLKWRNLR